MASQPPAKPTATSGAPARSATSAVSALRRGRMRAPATVGARWTSEAATTTVTKPKTLSQAWAGLSASHAEATGAHPASMAVDRATPVATMPRASA